MEAESDEKLVLTFFFPTIISRISRLKYSWNRRYFLSHSLQVKLMYLKLLKRRKFLWGLGLSALSFSLSQNTPIRANTTKRPPSVLVLGAGLSGLYAALLLERAGVMVTVLEGRDRVGGRVQTLDGLPGKPEAGAEVFSKKYSRLLKLAERYKVPLEPLPKPSPEVLFHVNGQSVLPKQWASSQANRLAKLEKQIPPPALMKHYLRPHNPLKTPTDWIAHKYRDLDISLKDFLLAQGASEEALRLMDIFPPTMNSIATTSALWGLKNDQIAQDRGSPLQVIGGNSRLPEKLAAALSSPIHLHKVIEEVRSNDTGVTVNCADGSSFDADYALLTLPFSVLRQIKIDPPLKGNQKEAVEKLPYTKITKVHFSVQGSFWKDDGYPLQMWTDSLLEQIFPVKDETGRVQGFVAWANGDNADKLARLSKQEVEHTVKAQLQQIRPAMAENVEFNRIITWGSDPFSLGAYSHFAPGQIRQWADEMVRPWHRIHFAGEHTAVAAAGMEAALESAERAVQELLYR